MTIYERIKMLRENLNMTQEQLAIKTGYKTRSAINKIESGSRDINQSQVVVFAHALGVTPSYLMGWTNDEDESCMVKEESAIYNDSAHTFENPEDAIAFLLEQPTIMAYGGYDLNTMSDEEIIEFANDILYAVKLSAERHKRKK